MKLKEPRLFTMIRTHDISGVSGTGRVLDGVVFGNGKVSVCWRHSMNSVAIYDSFECFLSIHVDSHPTNETEIIWLNETVDTVPFQKELVEENPNPVVSS